MPILSKPSLTGALSLALGAAAMTAALTPALSLASETPKKPNIVVILADDLGYSDLKSYGSEIDTPNLDQLANEGLRFSNYHTSASCAPTRAMLLSGVDSHRAGVANIAEAKTESQANSPFYNGTLNHNVVTIATLLKDQGYHTYMAGKWHLGYKDEALRPINRGFEQTVMMPYSGADNWQQRSYLPNYPEAEWFANGKNITLPDDFYSSKYIVDKSIEFIDSNKDDNQPFFSYVAFQAVHIPVQAPKEYTNKYLGKYDGGWGELRKQRQQAVKELGLVPKDAKMMDVATTQDWNALSEEDKKYHSKSMAVYAGMVDSMDANIGRLVQHLKDIGEYDNTIFIFTSDNGGEASDPGSMSPLFPVWLSMEDYNQDYETLGEKESYNYIGASFASAVVGPLGHYKFYSGEGGLRVPMIITGPALDDSLKGTWNDSFTYVKDLAPTILQLTNTQHPGTQYKGKTVEPMTGKSLVPIVKAHKDSVYGPKDNIAYEIGGNAALFQGDYKIMLNRPKLGDGQWHLYNIVTDPGETQDLREAKPELFKELKIAYAQYEKENGVLPVPSDYDQRRQVIDNAIQVRVINPIKEFFGSIF